MEKNKIKESYGDMASAVTPDGKKVMAMGSTRSTRTYNYEEITFRFNGKEGHGKYGWQNRPWQRFDFASALISAMEDIGIDSEFANECVDKTHNLESAVDYFAEHYKVNAKPQVKEEKEIKESADGWIAILNGKKVEVKKGEADSLYKAKQVAVKKFGEMFGKPLTKAKELQISIEPAYEDENKDAPASNVQFEGKNSAGKFIVVGYDKDNGQYDVYGKFNDLPQAKTLGANLSKEAHEDTLRTKTGEPIDWIEIHQDKLYNRLGFFDEKNNFIEKSLDENKELKEDQMIQFDDNWTKTKALTKAEADALVDFCVKECGISRDGIELQNFKSNEGRIRYLIIPIYEMEDDEIVDKWYDYMSENSLENEYGHDAKWFIVPFDYNLPAVKEIKESTDLNEGEYQKTYARIAELKKDLKRVKKQIEERRGLADAEEWEELIMDASYIEQYIGELEWYIAELKSMDDQQPASESLIKEEPVYGLEPQYDSRQSFYGKAKVDEREDGSKVLYSYGTPVAMIKNKTAYLLSRVNNYYGYRTSATTLRHVKDFLKQHGFKADSLSQIEKDYEVRNSITEGLGDKTVNCPSMSLAEMREYCDMWSVDVLNTGVKGKYKLIGPDVDEVIDELRGDGYIQDAVKEEVEDDFNNELSIEYWATEEDREEGFGDILIDKFTDSQEAISVARKMVDRDGFASVEVIDSNEEVVFGYDGAQTWGKLTEEELTKAFEDDSVQINKKRNKPWQN